MMVFALVFIAGGVLTVVALTIFVCDYLLPLVLGIWMGQLAFENGGGWPGTVVAGALAVVLAVTLLRLGAALSTPPLLRVGCLILLIVPGAVVAFGLTDAVLSSLVPSAIWRVALAGIAGLCVAANGYRKHFAYDQPRNQIKV